MEWLFSNWVAFWHLYPGGLKVWGSLHAFMRLIQSPMAKRFIVANARTNGYACQVEFRQVAVGACDKEEFFVANGIFGAGYFSVFDEVHHTMSERNKVLRRSIDSLVPETSASQTHVKIDVEGFEWEVLLSEGGIAGPVPGIP
jgi:FkbM family methyltransferase